MKTLLLMSAAIGILAQDGTATAQSVDDLAQRFRTTMDGREDGVDLVVKEITAAPPEQRKKLMAAVRQIIEEEFKSPQRLQNSSGIGPMGTCALVLDELAEENATLAAFGSRLPQVGFGAEPAVMRALFHCRDPKAMEAMTDLARLRLKELRGLVPHLPPPGSLTGEQSDALHDIDHSVFRILEALARNANSSGKAMARELRNEYLKVFDGSPYWKGTLQTLTAEIDPLLEKTPQPVPSRTHASAPSPKTQPKQISQPKPEQPAAVTTPAQSAGSGSTTRLVVAVVAVLGLLAIIFWFLRRK